jgi:hypothetical protein
MDGESRAEFNALLKGLRDDFRPEGTFQELQVEKLAVLYWRERRLVIADRRASSLPEFFGGPQQLDLALRYDATLNRNIDRTLAQFERHQRMRLGQPVPPPINLNITASKE